MLSLSNPWFSMWLQPKQSIKNIIKTNPKQGFFFLASIWFLHFFFLYQSYYGIIFFSHWIFLTIFAVIISPFIGAAFFYIFSWLLYKTGKLLKAKGSLINVRCAFAWSRLPLILDLFMWSCFTLFLKEILFQPIVGISFIFINLVAFSTLIWSFVLLVLSLVEVQKFSCARAIINVILAYFVIIIIFSILVLIYLFFFF